MRFDDDDHNNNHGDDHDYDDYGGGGDSSGKSKPDMSYFTLSDRSRGEEWVWV